MYSGPSSGMHAMCIVGYDDARQAYKVRNSWGSDWGENGYMWMSYSVLDTDANVGCYVVEDAYDPAVVSHITLEQNALLVPKQFKASDGTQSKSVELSWAPVAGATSYRIYRDTRFNQVGTASSASYTDWNAELGLSHLYWVRAVSPAVQSELSSPDTGYRKLGLDGGQ
jgi:hypothetical protein